LFEPLLVLRRDLCQASPTTGLILIPKLSLWISVIRLLVKLCCKARRNTNNGVNPPPYVIALSVFIIDTSDSIIKTTFGELQSIYTLLYRAKYSGFDGFLFDALNEKIRVQTKHLKADSYFFPTLRIDSNISFLYRRENLDGLIHKYCTEEKDSYVLRRASLTPTEINSISYYFFRNQFMQVNDDYEGSITFIRLKVLLNKYSD